jgi:hypothetical protein
LTISPQVHRLVLAAIAGDGYRDRERRRIREDIASASADELARALSATHVTVLFWARLGPFVTDVRLRDEFVATVRNHQIYNNALLTQLAEVRVAFGGFESVRPVILKGPSLWGWLYPDTSLRKTRDLDVLIQSPGDLERAVASLKRLGFSGDFDAIDQAIYTHDHYELPVLAKSAVIQVGEEDDERLQKLLLRYPTRPDFERLAPGQYLLRVEIELHKSFFLFTDRSYAPLPPSAVCEYELIPGLDRLTLAAQLPYVAAKFGMDVEGNSDMPPQPQSMKLLADFVLMIERASSNDISSSVEFSRLWHCGRYFGSTASTAVPLLPDVEFAGLSHPLIDLHRIIEMAAE